jgi:single-stranded-DNA-specific exonuclease
MEYRWRKLNLPPSDELITMREQWPFPEAVCSLLWQRGIRTNDQARTFFKPTWNDLHDPFLMADMRPAIDRIIQAMEKGEKVMVFGDYDVDGTTAVTVLSQVFRDLEIELITYIPDRYKEGYGLSKQGIETALENSCDLLIALDCGIKAVELVQWAVDQGLDVIIGDHHTPGDELPKALAVLDPKRNDCNYPFNELCGCGIAFKIGQALFCELGYDEEKLQSHLDLVALAIGADIVPIQGENRVLAHMGMKVMNQNPRPGIKAFLELTKTEGEMSITDMVFRIAPRINAAGRIEHGALAVDLLSETDLNSAREKAKKVHEHNSSRQTLDRSITQGALLMIEENQWEDRYSTVVYDPEWHKGVVGIVASRLTENYYRPTVVLTKSNGVLSGSARSVSGFDLYAALDACSEHLIQFGGHKFAAGMTLEEGKLEAFREAFERVVKSRIAPHMQTPEILVDLEIDIDDIHSELYRTMRFLAPFGPGNPSPVFVSRNLRDRGYAKTVGTDGDHLKLTVFQDGGQQAIPAIAFRAGHLLDKVRSETFHAAYHIEVNEWSGRRSLQLRILDIKTEE